MQSEAQILERAASLGYPMVTGARGAISTEAAWRLAVSDPATWPTLIRGLDEAEADQAHAAGRNARMAEHDTRRAEAARADPAVAEAFRREAAADLERHRREQPDRVEELLRSILAELQKR